MCRLQGCGAEQPAAPLLPKQSVAAVCCETQLPGMGDIGVKARGVGAAGVTWVLGAAWMAHSRL